MPIVLVIFGTILGILVYFLILPCQPSLLKIDGASTASFLIGYQGACDSGAGILPLIPHILTRRIDASCTRNISGIPGLHTHRLKIGSGSRCKLLDDTIGAMD